MTKKSRIWQGFRYFFVISIVLIGILSIIATGGGGSSSSDNNDSQQNETVSEEDNNDSQQSETVSEEDYKDLTKHNYINLDDIERISKFRSSEGHDYSDDFENCRTMKHYFCDPEYDITEIYSPIDGTITRIFAEKEDYPKDQDCQIWIESNEFPDIEYRIFHVDKDSSVNEGDKVEAGEYLGTFTDNEEGTNCSDIAIAHFTQEGEKLISYFNTLSEDVFQEFKDRGVDSRDDLIISKEERDESPLECDGEEYTSDSDPFDPYFWLE